MSKRKDYNVSGTVGDLVIKGIVKVYPKNIKEASIKGSKCSILSSLKTENNNIKEIKEEPLKI